MNKIFTTVLLSFAFLNPLSLIARMPEKMSIHEREFTFSTYYDIESERGSFGYVTKTSLSVRTYYEYYDADGTLDASAYLRLLSLGQAYTWAGTLDVYDSQGNWAGLIEGALATFCPARFNFYDADSNLVAIAYMDSNRMGFTVVDANNETRKIATFNRIFVPELPDHWNVTVQDPDAINPAMLTIFGAFMVDNQSEFKEDT